MAEYQEKSSKLSPVSSPEIRDSISSSNAGGEGGDEEFYEKIEAPKFVDFTVPDHFRPDDRYWFCHRVGCDQKHEEEMDSEAIYKNFVLRNTYKMPTFSSSKVFQAESVEMAIISSISEKMVDDKKRVVRPILKPRSTPVTKTKPVAAKYLTTPRNKKCIANENSFRSVQNPKPTNSEEPKSRIVAKALVFRSPMKAIKVKTSVELRTPISKLCDGMDKLEIQRENALGYSGKSSKNLIKILQEGQWNHLIPKLAPNQEAKSGNLLRVANKVEEGVELQELILEEACVSSEMPPPVKNPDLASPDDTKGERNDNDFMDGDDKENAAASDENRMHNKECEATWKKIFACVKNVAQTQDKNLKEGLISSATVMKLKKPKPTNPKPFRLRTDERGILKEANLEKRNDSLAPQTECANLSTPGFAEETRE
ncbi:UNVERIFIED_CONTAM: hypothetical protein Sradi_2830100 [Sesamum radiatum]|uniref:Uncharacterized protein n=1 Tax=Sesamum radiatum TaxID=300843 RepID=A0AAW2RW23_SESRA